MLTYSLLHMLRQSQSHRWVDTHIFAHAHNFTLTLRNIVTPTHSHTCMNTLTLSHTRSHGCAPAQATHPNFQSCTSMSSLWHLYTKKHTVTRLDTFSQTHEFTLIHAFYHALQYTIIHLNTNMLSHTYSCLLAYLYMFTHIHTFTHALPPSYTHILLLAHTVKYTYMHL